MNNKKTAERSQLIYEFGILMQPLEDLLRTEQSQPAAEYRIAIAKVQAGDSEWRMTVKRFATFADDVFFQLEFQDLSHVPERCWGELSGIVKDPIISKDPERLRMRLTPILKNARKTFFEGIERIPVQWEPAVFEANTPFTSYLRIKEAIAGVRRRLHYFDRYLKPDFFELFLASMVERSAPGVHLRNEGLIPDDRGVEVRLVTTAGKVDYGVAAVSAVARLAEQELDDFKLIEVAPADLHDRNLRIDDLIFTLGPGVDRAGIALTNFGPTDASEEAHAQFDQLIRKGKVVS